MEFEVYIGFAVRNAARALAAGRKLLVGYGSFRGLTNAERSKDELSTSTLRQLSIRSVSTNRGEFFRLVAGPFESISAARAAVARARRMGHEHAWLVIEPDGPVRVQLAQQGVAAPHPVHLRDSELLCLI